MKSNTLTLIRFVLAVFTLLAVAGQPYIPRKQLLVYPRESTYASLYGPEGTYGWMDQVGGISRCAFPGGDTLMSCGISLSWVNPISTLTSDGAEGGAPLCSDASFDEDGDGWGWENNASCIVPEGTPVSEQLPVCTGDSDEDGDGWGWENGRSCVMPEGEHRAGDIASEQPAEPKHHGPPTCSREAVDPDGDGWGWENETSCLMPSVPAQQEVAAEPGAGQIQGPPPVCMDASTDPDGDGWGWEEERSCVVPGSIAYQAAYGKSRLAEDEGRGDSCTDCEAGAGTEASAPPALGVDFSGYDGLLLSVFYEGNARHLRVHLRNELPPEAVVAGIETANYMFAFVRSEDLKAGPAYVDLKEFSVAEWWIRDRDVSRELAIASFNKIVSVGIENTEGGLHKLRIERVALVGERLSMKNLLLGIIVFWAVYLLTEAGARYYRLTRATRANERQIHELTSEAETLKAERSELQTLSMTDALTGIRNRAGLHAHAEPLFQASATTQQQAADSGIGVMLMDIDHFKHINDTWGHDVGDRVIKTFVRVVTLNLGPASVLARWGGEEFLLLTHGTGVDSQLTLAEKLRKAVASFSFEPGNIQVTVSVGAVMAAPGESFLEVVKRADLALYRAKEKRNRVEFDHGQG